jgi:hypothetical protein
MTMNDQLTFDATLSAAARDEAVQRVDQAADPEWKDYAYEAVLATAREKPGGFIVDDVWKHIPAGVEQPREPRAMGAVMRRAQKAGVIVPTDQYQLSMRITAHRNPRRIWVAA